jgi:Pyridoxal-dependent decarboxylase conserved domain
LGWGEAIQNLGPDTTWQIIKEVYEFDRMVVITSKGSHYSVIKACHSAGVGPLDVVEVAGSTNPWILDGKAFAKTLKAINNSTGKKKKKPLLLAVVAIAGKTETGYIDRIGEIAQELEEGHLHPTWEQVRAKKQEIENEIVRVIEDRLADSLIHQAHRYVRRKALLDSYRSAQKNSRYVGSEFKNRLKQQTGYPSYNRPFIHVDAAHGGAFLAVPSMRDREFQGINLADTVTLDGHKMFYCYYPCGGLLIRMDRWARTLHSGRSGYITEETNRASYGEDRWYLRGRRKTNSSPSNEFSLLQPSLALGANEMATLAAAHTHNDRPVPVASSELRHQPFVNSLEGSRGCQGIMQMYFNLNTIGFDGYQLLLEWTRLLSQRCSEAVSLGRVYVRPITNEALPVSDWMGNGKHWAMQYRTSNSDQTGSVSDEKARIAPILGGRLMRLSDGSCNQLLLSYIPQQIASDIISQNADYWTDTEVDNQDDSRPGSTKFWQTMHYLWRVNEHLWVKYLYANPAFTYYVGHTDFEPILPNAAQDASKCLEDLLCEWNVWTRWEKTAKRWHSPFFEVLADEVRASQSDPKSPAEYGKHAEEGFVRFFAHKIVVMHPYTDESILSDLLGKLMFWGERSAEAVRMADAACQQWLLGRQERETTNNGSKNTNKRTPKLTGVKR